MRALLAAVIGASTLAACATLAPATCDAAGVIGEPRLTCDQAIAAARTQYANTPGITELVVEYGPSCPPNARCMAPGGDIATVYATLEDGTELFVNVMIDQDGRISADPPQPVQFDRDQ